MSSSIHATLRALQDVQGIQGSFVLDAQGALLGLEMPALFDPSIFADIGPRIARMAESFAMLGDELESCIVRYSDHMLCIKQFPAGGALCILTDRTVNLAALKMAVNLADRRIIPELESTQPISTAAAATAPVVNGAAPAARPVQPEVKAAPRYYRGQLVEG